MNAWRLQRMVVVCIGAVLIGTPLVAIGTMVNNSELTEPWWSPVCVTLYVLSGALLMACGSERYRKYLPQASVLVALVQLAMVLLWFVAWTGRYAAPNEINPIWVTTAATLAGLVLAATINYPSAIGYIVVLMALSSVASSFAHAGHILAAESYRAAITGSLAGVFIAVVWAAMRVARRVDADRDRVLAGAAAGAARVARADERARLDAVARDEVIAVLRTVRAGRPDPVQADQAVVALAALAGSDGPNTGRAPAIAAWDAKIRIRETVVSHGDQVAVALDVDEDAGVFPLQVVDAIVDAVGEALLNSRLHAGADASQAVIGQLSGDRIRLRVVDDGVGFDPDRIAGDRMGIEKGIRARMYSVEGAADVDSAPGEGTMVSLEWVRR